MSLKRKVFAGVILSAFVVSNITFAAEISNKDKEVVTVNKKKITEEALNDAISLNASYAPALEVLDMKVLKEKYKDDSRLKGIIDKKYQEVKEANKEDDKDLKKEYASYGVKTKEAYLEKSGLLLEAYRELARIDTAYNEIFTKAEKDYVYKNKFSGTANIYHLLISPKITSTDALDETKLEKAKQEASKRAKDVVSELNKGMSFKDAVKKYSDDKINEDGLIGKYNVTSAKTAGVSQVITNAAFALEDKKYTMTPIETEYGYEIIYVEYTEAKKSYDDLKNDVASKLYELYSTNNQYTSEYALLLFRENNNIDIKDAIYSKAYANSLLTGRKQYIQYDPETANQYGNYGY
ncbi:parvulin-like peptidyl-prolyl isomerase [Bacilli bacterium PM5-3]|nr:parvulin-like peptidyl-prolyl isomerase [Bacilli bacterium PM5-3]MDH6603746.1 parvulin-like peptidyl-prolyl isomerase [Bacilli bacterium PM5-9]